MHFFKLLALPAQTRAPSAAARWRNQQRALLASVAVTGLLTGVHSVQADPYSWIGGPGAYWNDQTNWSPEGLPGIGDDVVIGQSYSVVVDAHTVDSIELATGGLTIDPTGQLIFQSVDVMRVVNDAATLNNFGSVTGALRENQGFVNNYAGAIWVGDLDNSHSLFNYDSATWHGDVHNSGNLLSQSGAGSADRPQWVGDVMVNTGSIQQTNGDWRGDVRINNWYIGSRFNSTWTGDVWDSTHKIFNLDTSTWNGDIYANSGEIENYDVESTWNGNVLANTGSIYNLGTWNGDVFTNSGLIFNYDPESTWNGNVLASTGNIYNEGTWNGDVLANSGSITNDGTWNGSITNSGTLRIGIGGTTGTVSGNVVNSGTLTFNRSDASTFGGTISGTGVVTKSGAGTLTLTGNASHTGGTTISAGTLQIGNGGTTSTLSGNVANSGMLAFNRSDASTYAGVISGNGAVTKSGAGTLVLSGTNTYVGATTVDSGTLSVNGSIAGSELTVNGGTLKGSGTVGTTTITSGTLAAGNSIGTLNVAGGLNLGAVAVLEVEVTGGANTLGVHSDLVAASGAVTINPSATVKVRPVNGTNGGTTFTGGTTYTIITSSGLSGTFASASDDFLFLDSALSYDSNNAYLTLKRNDISFAEIAETSNQTGAANALDAFAPGDPVTNALAGLSAADARRAYELASGDSHASAQAVLGQTFSLFQGAMGGSGGGSGAVMSYLDAGVGLVGAVGTAEPVEAPLAANAFWLTPMAGRGIIDSDGNGAATEWAAGGLAAGYERRSTLAGGDVVAGLGVGYTVATANTPTRLATSKGQGGQVGLYGEWSDDAAAFSGSLSYGANHISSTRDIVIGGLTNTATAQYWMQGLDAKLMAGYGFDMLDGLKVGPLAGMVLSWSGHGGFSETGAGGLNATVGASNTWRLESALGVQFAYELEGGAGGFEVSGRALWLHNFAEDATKSSVTLAGGGAPFSVLSPTSGRDRLELGAGLAWSASEQITLSFDYTGRFFGGQTDHIAKAGLTLDF